MVALWILLGKFMWNSGFICIKFCCIFPLEYCLPVGCYHRFDRTINQNHCKRENEKQTKQHSGTGCEQNLWPFLYCGNDTHQNALICLDAVELQKGKTDVLFSGILIYFVTQFINLQLNVRTEHILGPAQCIFAFSGNKNISYFFVLLTSIPELRLHYSRVKSLPWDMCQDAVCLADIVQYFKNLDRWGAISWETAFCWASEELRVEGVALDPADISVLLLAYVTANEEMMTKLKKKLESIVTSIKYKYACCFLNVKSLNWQSLKTGKGFE